MGFAVAYNTTEVLFPELQQQVIEVAMQMSSGRNWLSCEPLSLLDDGGHLSGVSKPNFTPDPDDVASANSEGLPDGTVNDLLDCLCQLSEQFGIDWEISHDYSDGPLGLIVGGKCDDSVRTQCDSLSELAGDLTLEDFDLDEM